MIKSPHSNIVHAGGIGLALCRQYIYHPQLVTEYQWQNRNRWAWNRTEKRLRLCKKCYPKGRRA